MKQILQNLKTGEVQLVETPCPSVKPGHLLIRTHTSLVSAGTERMLLEFGKANFIDKARQQPDKVRMVLDKVKTDGLIPTIESVRSKLDQPLPMGYCNVGTVLEAGSGVSGFSLNDRIVSNGRHSEVICVPKNLVAKIPDNVSDEEASFAVIGAIGLQGLRLARPELGEAFVVIGLGLVGLMTVQLLRAHGCRVLGIDFDKKKLELAKQFGAETCDLSEGEDPINAGMVFSRSQGVDGVIITASTKSNEPVHQAAQMCRKRGRIVLVGVVGLELSRADFYEKELSFQVSCSYGPGRYDSLYEEKGQDYPIGFVRWTEQRNFEAVLDMMSEDRLDVKPLISHQFPFDQAKNAYDLLDADEPSLGILLQYPIDPATSNEILRRQTIKIQDPPAENTTLKSNPVVALVGAGNYATKVLIPALIKAGAILKTVAFSGSSATGSHSARKFGFQEMTTDVDSVLKDEEVNTIVIATRHDSHTDYACRALEADKHVFVEKPLAINRSQLERFEAMYIDRQSLPRSLKFMVGFNRRFSPQVKKIKSLLNTVKEPKSLIMTVNSGSIPKEHWVQDSEVGGGRVIGECCHFIDLLRFLVGFPIASVQAIKLGGKTCDGISDDKVTFTLGFADGSFGTVHYLANGHNSFPKERLEVFCGNRILQLDNFITLRGFGWPGFRKMVLRRQDKGNQACIKEFIETILNGASSPIPIDEIMEVTQASFNVVEAIEN
jgi:predicted dehydrogenase/threonine dehydrogenase-like Zn-dependent dehydrogenase